MDPECQAKYASNGKIIFGSSVFLFFLVIILVFVHNFRRPCFPRRNHAIRPSLLKFLPTFTYSSYTHRSLHDCAVCLSEFSDGQDCRVLPNCNHAFHPHCIDAWLRSHSNCPLCRTPVHPHAVPVQPFYNTEPGSLGFSPFPAPVWCPRKSLDLEGEPDSDPRRSG